MVAFASGGVLDARASDVPRVARGLSASRSAAAVGGSSLVARIATMPLRFEANHGQFDERVSFLGRGSGYCAFLTEEGATLTFPSNNEGGAGEGSGVLAIRVLGGRSVKPSPSDRLPGVSNYFVGNEPSRWRTGVEGYARVRYADVIPGVDLVYYGSGLRRLEYDVVIAPGADPGSVVLAFQGAESVAIGGDGAALLRLRGGREILHPAPVAYQLDAAGRRERVDARYDLRQGGLAFDVGRFDPRRPLVIDPTLVHSTYLGGLGSDGAYGIALGSNGEAFVAGTTGSTNFPGASAPQPAFGGGRFDVFVAKIDAAGQSLVYSTYLGGVGDDFANRVAVDSAGEAFVTGTTASANFPMSQPLQAAFGGGPFDAFVAKLSASGSALVYSTYLGGTGNDQAQAIAVDGAGEAFVAGFTSSTNFPTAAPFQGSNLAASGTAFLTKLNAAGSAFVYSTYLGGSTQDKANGIAIDSAGEAYVTGFTTSTNFPIASALQGLNRGGGGDAFVAKLNATGSALLYSTYLGGSGADVANGIAVDAAGEAFIAGNTTSADFPTHAALQAALGGPQDAFVAKLDSAGATLVYSGYLGGSDVDYGDDIAVDGAGEAFVAGYTASIDFPTASAIQSVNAGKQDAFVAEVARAGSALVYSTYLGGTDNEQAYRIAVDSSGKAVVVGETASVDFPMASALQATEGGGDDAFVTTLLPPAIASVPALGDEFALLLAAGLFLVGIATASGLAPKARRAAAALGLIGRAMLAYPMRRADGCGAGT
jgi:hypothetical protein